MVFWTSPDLDGPEQDRRSMMTKLGDAHVFDRVVSC